MADDRLIEVMTELPAEVHQMRLDMNAKFDNLENRLVNVEKQQMKTNIELAELRLSNMKIAEKISDITNHESRLKRLEDAVFKKAS